MKQWLRPAQLRTERIIHPRRILPVLKFVTTYLVTHHKLLVNIGITLTLTTVATYHGLKVLFHSLFARHGFFLAITDNGYRILIGRLFSGFLFCTN